jgi:regulator of RNase E activity RraA
VGGLAVNEGDLLHGDANGVTNIPPEIAADVADVGQDFIAAEEILIGYAKSPGEKSVAKYAELRREFQSAVAALRKRVAKTR